MMKKITAMLLTLMICACCFGAQAEQEPATEEMPVMGLTFTYPQEMIDAKGAVATDGALSLGGSVYYAYWYYAALTWEELTQGLEADRDNTISKVELLFYLFAVGENRDFSQVSELTENQLTAENAVQIGQEGSWTYYLYMTPHPEFADRVTAEYYDEYSALCGLADKYAAACSFYTPFNPEDAGGETGGQIISFKANDLDGNPVSSAEIFSQHEITMVNIWATWCGPCVGELAELQEIHKRFLEKDCAVLGLMTDDDIRSAKNLIRQNGVTYQVAVNTSFRSVFPYSGIPTSFFVDRNGRFLGTMIVGAYPEKYEAALEPLLEQVRNAK